MEVLGAIKYVAVIALTISATVLVIVLTIGLSKLIPVWIRIAGNIEKTTASTAKITQDLANVSEEAAQDFARLMSNSAQTAENLKDSTTLLANLSRFNVRAIAQAFSEGNVNNVRDLGRFITEHWSSLVGTIRRRTGD